MSNQPSARRFPRALPLAGFLLWGLVACQTRPPAAKPEAATPAVAPPAASTAREFRIVPEESLLQIMVYRGGPMARLGHNHVIASHALSGVVMLASDPLQTRFDVKFLVSDLTIDEPALREQAGADFTAAVAQTARDGTRKNMLSAGLLDATNYPEIRIRATDVVANGDAYDVGVEITVKDQVRTTRVPVHVTRKDDELTASAEFPLRQSDLGLKPFSVMMGSLLVLDEMHVSIELKARSGD